MYTLPRYAYLRRSMLHGLRKQASEFKVPKHDLTHTQRVRKELRSLGVSRWAMGCAESRYLPSIIHPDEHLGGVVYGFHADGYAMMVATDRRAIFLDKKPMFTNVDEVNYYVISGVKVGTAGVGSTVTLHTRIKDYTIKTFNQKCAYGFVEFIEARCLEHGKGEDYYDQIETQRSL